MAAVKDIYLIGAVLGEIVGIVDPGPDPPAWSCLVIYTQRCNKTLPVCPVVVRDRVSKIVAQIPVGFPIKVWQVVLNAGRKRPLFI